MLAFSFNLCSNAFIVYTFTDVTQFAGGTVPPQVIDDFKKQPKRVHVTSLTNELPLYLPTIGMLSTSALILSTARVNRHMGDHKTLKKPAGGAAGLQA